MDLPSLAFAASRRSPRAQESPSEPRIRSSSPAESAQEPRSTVRVAFLVVAIVSSTFPASNSFPAISSTVLGSSKRAGVLGEGCVPLVAKHGKDLSRLGRESVPPALQSEQRLVLVSLPNLRSCSHCSLVRSLDQLKIVFALRQTSPRSSPLPSPWQPLPRPR